MGNWLIRKVERRFVCLDKDEPLDGRPPQFQRARLYSGVSGAPTNQFQSEPTCSSLPFSASGPWVSDSMGSALMAAFSRPSGDPDGCGFPSASAGSGVHSIERWLIDNVNHNTMRIELVRSRNILDEVIPRYDGISGDELRRMTSVAFRGEDGVDMGGVTTEFFFVTFEAVRNGTFKGCRVTEGERGHLLPSASCDCRLFATLGRVIVHAVINGCRGLPGLSPAIVHYLTHRCDHKNFEDSGVTLSKDDVADSNLKQLLEKYERGEDFDDSEKESWLNWLTESNCHANWRRREARQMVIQDVLVYYVFTKRLRHIMALEEGLNSLGLREFLIGNWSEANVAMVFPTAAETEYSCSAVLEIIVTRDDYFDATVFEFFKKFLRELSDKGIDGFRLCDLVQFVTSSRYFPQVVVVSFSSDITVPVAHACFNEIVLPLSHQTYPEFKESVLTALKNGLEGFQLQ